MKYYIQYIYKKQYLTTLIIIISVLILLHYQNKKLYSSTNIQNNKISENYTLKNIHTKTNNNTKIRIQANQSKFYINNQTAYFCGNVIVINNNNTLYADKIFLNKILNNNITTNLIISGIGNISYTNDLIQLTGKKISTNIQTSNTDLYQGHFYFLEKQIYGTSYYIKQRKKNKFTILKKFNFTTCPTYKKYWKIKGSKILYDHKKETINIWDSYFKIKNIPILYIPYIQLPLTNKNNVRYYPPIPQYNNKHGMELKIPYHFHINKNSYGKITTNFIPKKGLQFQNHIKYSNNLNKVSINFDILNNNKVHNNKNYWILYWKYEDLLKKRWNIKSQHTILNNHNYFYNHYPRYIHTSMNYYLKKKISCKYIHTIWNIHLSYKEHQPLNTKIKNIYNTKPQLNINTYTNKFQPLNCFLFGQITEFKSTNHNYPNTTRLHIEPTIHITSNILNTVFCGTEITFYTTHYKQNNINFYNKKLYTNHNNEYLKHSINRFLPQFKSYAKTIFQKKENILNNYKQMLEHKIQYSYIPYCNQKHIGLYDTTIFQIDQSDPFYDKLYSGLDRIASTNQLINSINTTIYNKNNNKLFYGTLGHIYSFTPQQTGDYIKNNSKITKTNTTWTTNNHLIINKSLRINTTFQYTTQIKKLKSGNAIIEYHSNNQKILQINYRYFNSKHFKNITPEPIDPIYQNNITQIGIIGNLPINNFLTLSSSQFYNTKNQQIINQTIGIQYRTYCWKMNIGYEKKINIWKKTTNNKNYINQISIKLILFGINDNSKLEFETCNTLNNNTLPYQTIFINSI